MNIDNTQSTAQSSVTYKYAKYDSQLPLPVVAGMRNVKCLYKENPKTGKKAGENSYISIPTAHISEQVVIENVTKLAPYIVNFLASEEDKLIKEHHKAGGIGFNDTWLSLTKILESLDEQGQGNRLNKEKIEEWFISEMQEPLVAAFANKLDVSEEPTQEELEKLAAITQVYKAKFASLASGKTHYRVEESELLQKALEVTECKDTVIGSKFYDRLERMKIVTNDDLLLSL